MIIMTKREGCVWYTHNTHTLPRLSRILTILTPSPAYRHNQVRKYEKDRKAQAALQRAKEATVALGQSPPEVGQKRKAGGEPGLEVAPSSEGVRAFVYGWMTRAAGHRVVCAGMPPLSCMHFAHHHTYKKTHTHKRATQPKIYDFDVPENFEKELLTLIPRHIKFTGVPQGSSFAELRDFFSQVRPAWFGWGLGVCVCVVVVSAYPTPPYHHTKPTHSTAA